MTFEYGDDGILTVVIADTYAGRRQRFAIQNASPDAPSPKIYEKIAAINEKVIERTERMESAEIYRSALELLRRAEQMVLPKVDNPEDRTNIEELCRELRRAMGVGDLTKADELNTRLANRLLDFAHLL